MAAPSAVQTYIRTLQANLARGNATEHTHRPALKALLEAVGDRVTATNEPKRIQCGAPDFAITGANRLTVGYTVGYVEAKDVDSDLAQIERDSGRAKPLTANGRQLKRYREALPNLLLTNYIEFRWYVDAAPRGAARLAARAEGGALLSVARAERAEGERLLWEFLSRAPARVASPDDLAQRMARLAHMIRAILGEGFKRGQISQDVKDLHEATKRVLVPDLGEEEFADMFAQTLTYGLFAARVSHDAGPFRRQDAAHRIPPTNPFLQQLFSVVTGPALDDEPFVSFVDDLTQLLGGADMEAVLADFGKRAARQDPIMHFYETFLDVYNPAQRERRGVYYTPEQVVSYIVRSVDWLLRERFGCAAGLADHAMTDSALAGGDDGGAARKRSHRVLVLDPACGTGTFLYAVIDQIRAHYRNSGNAGMWSGYVREHLLKRLFGFELLMAPYAMAHLKLGMQLAGRDMAAEDRPDWSYEFDSAERLGVYLTNSLEQAEGQAMTLFGPLRVITEEANAAAAIKRDLPIMVVLGNPPYSGHSANASRRGRQRTWIGERIEDYKKVDGKPLGERNPKWLQDDYVKFIRFGQWRIEQSGAGILAFITNNAYLDNPTFRGMRQQLMETFSDIYILDLHGNAKKKERAPDGGPDQNVFDIQQGVAIALFVKEAGKAGPAAVRHAELWGTRPSKYKALAAADASTTAWQAIQPAAPHYLFRPWDRDREEAYRRWPPINEIMPVNSVGVVTARDRLTIRWSRDEVMEVTRDFAHLPAETARERYNLGKDREWKVQLAQSDLIDSGLISEHVVPILYRPFDTRYTYYTGKGHGFICMPRREVMRHMLEGANLALITTRQTRDSWAAIATNSIMAHKALAAYDINYLFPLYTYPSAQEIAAGLYRAGDRMPNISPAFTAHMERNSGLRFRPEGAGDLRETFGAEDVLHYIYAVFHAPTYRLRYDQFLRIDFPRVPLSDDVGLFRALVGLGGQLAHLHLMESAALDRTEVGFPVRGDDLIERGYPRYLAPGSSLPGEKAPLERGRVYISKEDGRAGRRGQYFEGIAPDVWAFRVGGYQPMEKWLKDRRGRTLSFDDLNHYRRMAHALAETRRLMQEIDAAIGAEGGLFSD